MMLIPVTSSNLAAVGYQSGILVIAFHSGGVYQYFGVPYERYAGLLSAASHGKYFWAYIRNHYSYQRIN